MLTRHIEHMNENAKLILRPKPELTNGFYIAPHLYEIKNINELKQENFGPILHLIRFKAN